MPETPWSAERLGELVEAVWQAPARAGATTVVAVDGPSGSGKSALADALAEALGGAPVVRLDDVYPGWDGLDETPPRIVAEVLSPLSLGQPAGYRRYDWTAGRYRAATAVPAAPVLVLDGCGSGARVCAPFLSLLVWLDAAPEVRRRRALARDGETYRPHWERWASQEAVHFAREATRERADVRWRT